MHPDLRPYQIDFDHLGAEWRQNPHPLWDFVRASGRIPFSKHNGMVYLPTRYDDIKYIAANPNIFSSRSIMVGPQSSIFQPMPPITLDPPLHDVHRGIITSFLTAQYLESLRGFIHQRFLVIADQISSARPIEVVASYSAPSVIAVFRQFLGVPEGEHSRFREIVRSLTAINRTITGLGGIDADADQVINNFLMQLIEYRRLHPAQDLVSHLVKSYPSQDYASTMFLVSMVKLLMSAGMDTTIGVITSGIYHLSRENIRKQLRDKTFTWKAAVEEFIRISSPALLARRSVVTTEVRGCPIAGDRAVLLPFAAANRDPKVFNNPHFINLHRRRNHHLGFGYGIHRCLGMHLARIIVGESLKIITAKFPHWEIHQERVPVWSQGPVRTMTELWISPPAT